MPYSLMMCTEVAVELGGWLHPVARCNSHHPSTNWVRHRVR